MPFFKNNKREPALKRALHFIVICAIHLRNSLGVNMAYCGNNQRLEVCA